MAIDDGLILPDTLIDDHVLRIGDYAPRNFDRLLHGEVTAAQALQQSYNLPAVALLAHLGPARFAATLQSAGATLRWPRGSNGPGLPLALGGVGISLEDLTALYVGLADDGRGAPLRVRASDKLNAGAPIMTATAARQIRTILQGAPLPDGVAPARQRGIAYKTGTSYGFRDAWAMGVSGAYTVGVWVGRVDGTPRPGAYGRDTAAPILFRLFDLLPAEPSAAPADPPPPRHRAPALRHFAAAEAPAPRITFPPADAKLAFGRGDSIALEVSGGAPPYTWLVDGLPLPRLALGLTPEWRPEGPGFARVSVVDRHGRSASEMVELVGAE
jgi:penicillin-binding protein 1C